MKFRNYYFLILILLTIINYEIEKLMCNKRKNDLERIYKKLYISNQITNIYSILYDKAREGYNKPKYESKEKIYNFTKKKGICICSISKKENLYIREFVEYYFLLGIKKIIIYDNNDIDGEKLEEVISDFIINKFVEIIDVRGLTSIQIPIYNYCYQRNKDIFDWIGFVDIDEYVYIKNNNNINSFIYKKTFSKCELIFLNWLIYNDNDIIKYKNKPLAERFKKAKTFFNQGKSFVRGGFKNLLMPSTHIPGININYYCNSNGKRIYPKDFFSNQIENMPQAYIKHYYTKTVEEFCKKIIKGNAHFNINHPDYIGSIKDRVRLFFLWNEISEYKINILEKCTGLNLNEYKKNKVKL